MEFPKYSLFKVSNNNGRGHEFENWKNVIIRITDNPTLGEGRVPFRIADYGNMLLTNYEPTFDSFHTNSAFATWLEPYEEKK